MPCRFALATQQETLEQYFALRNSFCFKPRFNIAPGQVIPIVRFDPKRGNILDFVKWGFDTGWGGAHINARAETVLDKPSFKSAIFKQRCIIPVTGYYEWKMFKAAKQPYYIFASLQPLLCLAGIWARHRQDQTESVCILTLPSIDALQVLGERMPLFISQAEIEQWLSPKLSVEKLTLLLKGAYFPQLSYRPVSKQVNHPGIDQPVCILPL